LGKKLGFHPLRDSVPAGDVFFAVRRLDTALDLQAGKFIRRFRRWTQIFWKAPPARQAFEFGVPAHGNLLKISRNYSLSKHGVCDNFLP
jgi:hypothetical protein